MFCMLVGPLAIAIDILSSFSCLELLLTMGCLFKLLLILTSTTSILLQLAICSDSVHSLQKRFLLFPRQAPTRHQFIGGIGIPADLEYESLVVGHVLKAEFYLPYNATVFRENIFLPEYKVEGDNYLNTRKIRKAAKRSKLRWDFYEYITDRLKSYGYNGEECLLRTICEANAMHFERDLNVFAELMHIFLSPSTSLDAETIEGRNFLEAEKLGISGNTASCAIYACQLSLLELFSRILHIDI